MAELTPRMKELVQPYLAGIEPYDPNFTPTRINLSANENTYPVPAGVREAVDAALAATPLNRYPDPMSNDLRDELAAWHGVTRENICVGNGGDELLYNYLLAFGGAGRTLLNCPPCFSEYAFFASLCQTEVRDVWRDPATFELDQAAVLAAAPECNLAIVTSPNNPTGDVAPLDFVAALCDACPGMVMVDEAYVEFADDSFGAATTAQGLIAEHPNLVILHTLSKAFGAAGTRLGYVSLDLVHIGHGVVPQLNGLIQEFLGTTLLFQTLVNLFPCTILIRIHLTFTVLGSSTLSVNEALRAINDRTDTTGNIQITLCTCITALLGKCHAMMTSVVKGIACSNNRLTCQIRNSLNTKTTGNYYYILCTFRNQIL